MLLEIVVAWALGAGDWTQFRGPNSDGTAAGPATPLVWSDTENVVWKSPIPGLGWSSPAIADGRVFLTTAVRRGEGLSLRALALDVRTGKILWDREVREVAKAPAIHQKNSHASPTPLVRDGSVFVHFGALGMARLAASDGAIQWICTELDYPPMHGSGGSPVLHDGKLVVVCDGSKDPFVAAVDAETGKVVWKTPRSVAARVSHSFVTPTIAVVDGQAQVMAPGPDHFAAYDLKTGLELWQVKAPGWSVVPQPTLGHGLVIYNHDYDNPELVAIRLGGKGDVTETHVAWRIKRGAPSTPSPLLVGQELYFVSDAGIASCVDVKTGERHWMERFGGNYSASPVFANGRILFLNETGLATWVKAGKEFEIMGTNEVPGRTFATPAFSDGAMYLRTDENLYKISQSR
jgi:outer membrane protein assembly factor BamB